MTTARIKVDCLDDSVIASNILQRQEVQKMCQQM